LLHGGGGQGGERGEGVITKVFLVPENYDKLIFVCTRGGWGSQMGPLGKVSGLPFEENTPKKLSNP